MSARDEPVSAPVEKRGLGDWVKLGVGIGGAGLLILFFLQNMQEVSVNVLWFDWTTRMIWALLAAAILGALSSAAFSTIRGRARRKEMERAARSNR
jgi:uncharacterized integral membrane protein